MDFKKILLYIGLPLVSVGIITGVVLVLRARNQVPETVPISSVAAPAPTQSLLGGSKRGTQDVKLTPQEQADRDEITKSMKNQPANYQDTWTPEYRAKMAAQVPTTTKIIETNP